jgi:hypothetical protein
MLEKTSIGSAIAEVLNWWMTAPHPGDGGNPKNIIGDNFESEESRLRVDIHI